MSKGQWLACVLSFLHRQRARHASLSEKCGEGGGGGRDGAAGNGLDARALCGSGRGLDGDAGPAYAAAGNPFDGSDGRTQIWAYGIRNPWRFSFDRGTGDLWIGDVGQGSFEEITWMPSPIAPGANLGWRAYEGFSVFDEGLVSMVPDHFEPIIDYRQGRDDEPIPPACSSAPGSRRAHSSPPPRPARSPARAPPVSLPPSVTSAPSPASSPRRPCNRPTSAHSTPTAAIGPTRNLHLLHRRPLIHI